MGSSPTIHLQARHSFSIRGASYCRQTCSFTSVCVGGDGVLIRILMTWRCLASIQRPACHRAAGVCALNSHWLCTNKSSAKQKKKGPMGMSAEGLNVTAVERVQVCTVVSNVKSLQKKKKKNAVCTIVIISPFVNTTGQTSGIHNLLEGSFIHVLLSMQRPSN